MWHDGTPITAADWQATWNALSGLDPEFQAVSREGYELITSVEQGADEFEVVVTFCQPYPDHEALFSPLAPAASYADPETYNTGWIGPINNDWMTGPFEVGSYDEGGAGRRVGTERHVVGRRAVARLDLVHGDQ